MATLDLRDVPPAPLGAIPPLDPRERALLVSTWRGRMVNEHASARVFAELVPLLMESELPAALQLEAAEMAKDELRHARACASVLAALGEPAVGELLRHQRMPEHAHVSRVEAVFRNVIAISCIAETIAVALIDGERRELGEHPAGAVLKAILGDEVRHARFGWRLLEAHPLEPSTRASLSGYLELAFGHAERHELRNLAPLAPPDGSGRALGLCDGEGARALFYATVDEVVVPRLESFGLDARRAWARRRVA